MKMVGRVGKGWATGKVGKVWRRRRETVEMSAVVAETTAATTVDDERTAVRTLEKKIVISLRATRRLWTVGTHLIR